jgi:hypothetical protein
MAYPMTDCEWRYTNAARTLVTAPCAVGWRTANPLLLDDAERFSYCPYCGQWLVLPSGDGSEEEMD